MHVSPAHAAGRLAMFTPNATQHRSRFGDIVIVAFLVAQVLDGLFTYLGVKTFGPAAEGNPLLFWLMNSVGEGPALAGAKLMAGTFGIALHLTAVHKVIAVLTLVYIGAALVPWATILFL
jgi:hypothetical protein